MRGGCLPPRGQPRPSCPQLASRFRSLLLSGASSGLHHDFHDNLYVLLRGRKRFRLYPPQQAADMYTHGKITKVYPNGRVVYQGQVRAVVDCWLGWGYGAASLGCMQSAATSTHSPCLQTIVILHTLLLPVIDDFPGAWQQLTCPCLLDIQLIPAVI